MPCYWGKWEFKFNALTAISLCDREETATPYSIDSLTKYYVFGLHTTVAIFTPIYQSLSISFPQHYKHERDLDHASLTTTITCMEKKKPRICHKCGAEGHIAHHCNTEPTQDSAQSKIARDKSSAQKWVARVRKNWFFGSFLRYTGLKGFADTMSSVRIWNKVSLDMSWLNIVLHICFVVSTIIYRWNLKFISLSSLFTTSQLLVNDHINSSVCVYLETASCSAWGWSIKAIAPQASKENFGI